MTRNRTLPDERPWIEDRRQRGKTCSVERCQRPAHSQSYCQKHYQRWRKYGDPLGGKTRYEHCSVNDCTKPHYARGYCEAHYRRWRLYDDAKAEASSWEAQTGECSVDGCTRGKFSRGYCLSHYRRWERHGNPLMGGVIRQPLPEICQIEGCDRPAYARAWCVNHYQRWRRYGDPEEPSHRPGHPDGWRGMNNQGYVVIKKSGKTALEHRLVMEQQLGRKLYAFENVHHKNTVKTDNRPGNLEIFTHVQPSGGRLEDILDWIVAMYPDETRAALERRAVHS